MSLSEKHSIILLDDECVLCNKLIRKVALWDVKDKFRITGLKTVKGQELLQPFNKENSDPNSLILIEDAQLYEASEAVLRILLGLNRFIWLSSILKFMPHSMRNRIYYFIAKNRYRFFGKSNQCSLDENLKSKITR